MGGYQVRGSGDCVSDGVGVAGAVHIGRPVMTTYWCANFDAQACLDHGIDNDLWMMQYQYADDHGS